MTGFTDDRELLERAFGTYDQHFAAHVGEIVTPYEYLDTTEQVEWVGRIFMFAYGLGSVAGARTARPEETHQDIDRHRVESIVAEIVAIHESEGFAVTNDRIVSDFLE